VVTSELYPFTGHYFDHGGLRQHYLDEGSGAPVVMLHGNPSWSFYYRHLVLTLRDRYRVIAPDHIGCGLSDKPGDDRYSYTLRQRVDDLEALLESLDLRENITLVVHDWGGMIGMAYASRHPERIARLVILNTGAFHLPQSKTFPLALKVCRTPLGALLIRGGNAFARAAARVGCKRRPMSAELRAAYCAPYNSWRNRIATLRFVQDIPLAPGDPGYELISEVQNGLHRFAGKPMLILWGEQDFVFDRHFLAEWRRRFPQAEVHAFDDCGHYILEDARAEVIPLIYDFLEHHRLPEQG
jgi:cis-3-alkyl-4-acyloxetan-2-one decarboxylase